MLKPTEPPAFPRISCFCKLRALVAAHYISHPFQRVSKVIYVYVYVCSSSVVLALRSLEGASLTGLRRTKAGTSRTKLSVLILRPNFTEPMQKRPNSYLSVVVLKGIKITKTNTLLSFSPLQSLNKKQNLFLRILSCF